MLAMDEHSSLFGRSINANYKKFDTWTSFFVNNHKFKIADIERHLNSL
jgi:hypothetical protein